MKVQRTVRSGASGFSLVETMAAMVILVIAALGALVYQYHAAGQGRIANAQITGTRTAELLLEDWMSTGGSSGYDPTALGLGFSALTIPSAFTEGQGLGNPLHSSVYAITVDGTAMLTMLSWMDVAQDVTAQVTLRQLAVIVKFRQVDEEGRERASGLGDLQPVTLTTYIRLDAAGG